MADKCFCHLNGFEVKDKWARDHIPLICNAFINFGDKQISTGTLLERSIHQSFYNRTPVTGDKFNLHGTNSKGDIFYLICEVVKHESQYTSYKVIDFTSVLIGELKNVTLILQYTLAFSDQTIETLRSEGYRNSVVSSAFNRIPEVGNVFYCIATNDMGDVFGLRAKIEELQSNGYAKFSVMDVDLIHDSAEITDIKNRVEALENGSGGSGGSSGGTKLYRHLCVFMSGELSMYRISFITNFETKITSLSQLREYFLNVDRRCELIDFRYMGIPVVEVTTNNTNNAIEVKKFVNGVISSNTLSLDVIDDTVTPL